MRKSFGILLAVGLLSAVPAFAGNLAFENGLTVWRSTQCVKPNPPGSVLNAHPETAGEDMNGLVAQHNAYVDAAQAYMNCLGNEAERDQAMVTQSITSGAQKAIADVQAEVDGAGAPLRGRSR